MKEIYKDIPGYEGLYQASNLGDIKSFHGKSERVLNKPISSTGYYRVCLFKNRTRKYYSVHQLVMMTFKNHIPNGYKLVIDHINNVKTDDRVDNLRIITQRENAYTHHVGSSKYKGVSFNKKSQKWDASMRINGKSTRLGTFEIELDAHNAYQNKLKTI